MILNSRQQEGKECLVFYDFNLDTDYLLLLIGICHFVPMLHSGWLLKVHVVQDSKPGTTGRCRNP